MLYEVLSPHIEEMENQLKNGNKKIYCGNRCFTDIAAALKYGYEEHKEIFFDNFFSVEFFNFLGSDFLPTGMKYKIYALPKEKWANSNSYYITCESHKKELLEECKRMFARHIRDNETEWSNGIN